MYPLLKLLCNISPKTGNFFRKFFFCLTYVEGDIIFRIEILKSPSCNDYNHLSVELLIPLFWKTKFSKNILTTRALIPINFELSNFKTKKKVLTTSAYMYLK